MNTNKKVLDLINHGISGKFLSKLTESQINIVHSKLMESKKENKEAVTKTSTTTTYDLSNQSDISAANKSLQGVATIDPNQKKLIVTKEENEMDEDSSGDLDLALALQSKEMTEKKEIEEKFESKSQQKYFWARCNRSKGKEKTKWCNMAKEFSEKTSKKDYKKMPEKLHPEKTVKVKKEQKEGFMDMVGKGLTKANLMNLDKVSPSVKWESKLEKRISQIVEKHLNPKMTKGELLKFVKEQKTKESPTTKPKEPTTTPKEPKHDPDSPYKVKPGTKPAPKAETKEQAAPTTKPKEPTTTPGTKEPVRTPSTPYQPKTKPAPKARKTDMPNWLNFKTVGIKLK